jgi:hypothetical protein
MSALPPAAPSDKSLDRRSGDARRRKQYASARARFLAWCRVLDAVAEMRAALDYRVWSADPDDTLLEADMQTWCELARALADFLRARRTAT